LIAIDNSAASMRAHDGPYGGAAPSLRASTVPGFTIMCTHDRSIFHRHIASGEAWTALAPELEVPASLLIE